jgi:hypothetical protein
MSLSRFEQLREIIEADYTNTYEYLKQVFSFIQKLGHNLADYLGCERSKIFILDSENKRTQIDGFIQDSVIFEEGYFKFNLLVSITETPFNLNSSGKSFFQNSLTPPSGVILGIGVKYTQNRIFTVKCPGVEKEQASSELINTLSYEFDLSDSPQTIKEQSFLIEPSDKESWLDFLESSFQAMKIILENNLEQRIKNLPATKDNFSQSAFGFRLDNSMQ